MMNAGIARRILPWGLPCLLLAGSLAAQDESKRDAEVIVPEWGPINLLENNLERMYVHLEDTKYKDPKGVFKLRDGVLRISGESWGGLISRQRFANYHMVCEFKWGKATWSFRKKHARDSGLLVHCFGPDAGFNGRWMASIEAQIIEGGTGDFLALSTKDPKSGKPLPVSLTAETALDPNGQRVWKKGGEPVTIHRGRINWKDRDPDWVNETGVRGKNDVESPYGEWTRLDVVCEGDKITNIVNGVVVNHCFDVQPSAGKVFIQSEGAEMFVRRWELWPLGKAPKYQAAEKE